MIERAVDVCASSPSVCFRARQSWAACSLTRQQWSRAMQLFTGWRPVCDLCCVCVLLSLQTSHYYLLLLLLLLPWQLLPYATVYLARQQGRVFCSNTKSNVTGWQQEYWVTAHSRSTCSSCILHTVVILCGGVWWCLPLMLLLPPHLTGS